MPDTHVLASLYIHSNPDLIVGVVLRFTLFLLKFDSVDFGDASPGKALEVFPFWVLSLEY